MPRRWSGVHQSARRVLFLCARERTRRIAVPIIATTMLSIEEPPARHRSNNKLRNPASTPSSDRVSSCPPGLDPERPGGSRGRDHKRKRPRFLGPYCPSWARTRTLLIQRGRSNTTNSSNLRLLREVLSPDAGVCGVSCWTLPYLTRSGVHVCQVSRFSRREPPGCP
jgi:hypothetical protein